jgi:predicted amidophosphoribosyltransferase
MNWALSFAWLANRFQGKTCPRCGADVKKGRTTCDECGFDFGASD